jgi:hypothetical protein
VDDSNPACITTVQQVHIVRLLIANMGLLKLQVPEEKSKDGSWVQKGSKPVLALSHQQVRQPQQ